MAPLRSALLFIMALTVGHAAHAAKFNEVHVDNSGFNEGTFVELLGAPGESLTSVSLVQIDSSGLVTEVEDLSAYSFAPAKKHFVIAGSLVNFPAADVVPPDFHVEGFDIGSLMLVRNFGAVVGDDLDLDDDLVIDTPTSYTELFDAISFGNQYTGSSLYFEKMPGYKPFRSFDTGPWQDLFIDYGDPSYPRDTAGLHNALMVIRGDATGTFGLGDANSTMVITQQSIGTYYEGYGFIPSPVAYRAERIAGDPGSAGFSAGTVTGDDGTSLTVNRHGRDASVRIRRNILHIEPTSNQITYNLGLDISDFTSGVVDPAKLVLLKRPVAASPWQPFSSTLAGGVLWAAGLTSFSDYTIGSDSSFNPLPVSLSAVSFE